jgi:hypothetical protein
MVDSNSLTMMGASEDSSDLTVTDEIQSLDQIGKLVEAYFLSDSYRTDRHLSWYRNVLFYAGKQYLRRVDNWWQSVPRTRFNRNLPRPVVNQIRVETEALTSVLTANAPKVNVDPNSKSAEDKAAAELGEIVLDAKDYSDNEEELREKLALWAVTTGNAFRKDYWDSDAAGGNGDTRVSIPSPFTMTVNPQASCDQDIEWIMETQPTSFNEIRRVYGKEGNGYTGLADTVKAEASYNEAIQRLLSLRALGEFHSDWTYGYDDRVFKNYAIVKEWYSKPTRAYPKGRMVVTANGVVLFRVDESPYYDEAKGLWHPYTHMRYLNVPANFWGRTPFTDGVDIQRSLNNHYSLIELNNQRTASPHIMVPFQSGVHKGTFSGKPGTIWRYKFNPQFPGAKPEVLQGRGMPPDVFNLLEILKTELSRVMGVHDILKGDKITGVNNYSSLELLREEANKNMNGPVRRFERMIERGSMIKLILIQRYMKKEREDFTMRLQTFNRDITALMVKSFKGADLRGNHSVRVEARSIAPKSIAAQRTALIEAAQYGVFTFEGDVLAQAKAAELLDVPIESGVSVHVKRASAENDKLRQGIQQPTVFDEDDHALHIAEHNRLYLDPNFFYLSADAQKFLEDHIEVHKNILSQQQQQQLEQEMEMLERTELIKAKAKIEAEAPKIDVERQRVGVEGQRVQNENVKNISDAAIKTRELDIKASEGEKKNESASK